MILSNWDADWNILILGCISILILMLRGGLLIMQRGRLSERSHARSVVLNRSYLARLVVLIIAHRCHILWLNLGLRVPDYLLILN